MKILMLNHEFPPVGGGAGNATRHLARELAALGIEVRIVTTAFGSLTRREETEGYEIERIPAVRSRALEARPIDIGTFLASAWGRLPGIVRTFRPHLIHAFFGFPAGFVAASLRRRSAVPYIVSLRGRDVHAGKSAAGRGPSGVLRRVTEWAWKNAAALVSVSEGLKRIALEISPGMDVTVIPNGVDSKVFRPGDGTVDSEEVVVLFVGRLEPYKRIHDLLQAVSRLRAGASGRIRLRIAGDGSLRGEIPRAVEALDLQDTVEMLGHVTAERIPELYRQAHIFVLPSLVEGMPNVILEAMASGIPTVATRVPGSEELIVPGETGLLCAPMRVDDLARHLRTLVENPALRKRMGRAARSEAESRSWESAARKYLSVYRRTAGGDL